MAAASSSSLGYEESTESDDEMEVALMAALQQRENGERASADAALARGLQEAEYASITEEAPSSSSTPSTSSTPSSSTAAYDPERPCRLLQLPDELLHRILLFIPPVNLLDNMRWVSRKLGAACVAEAKERTRRQLFDALIAGFGADADAGPSSSSGAKAEPPPRGRLHALSAQLEGALLSTTPSAREAANFSKKCRQLCFNLKDKKNPELRHKLLSGDLEPAALAQLSGKELASGSLQQQRSEWHQKRLRCAIKPEREVGFATDLYRCDNCGCASTRVHRVIRAGRMAVDRARTYATCVECKSRWEV